MLSALELEQFAEEGFVHLRSAFPREVAVECRDLAAAQLSIEAEPDLPVEADGEVLGVTPASFGIIPGAIRLKV